MPEQNPYAAPRTESLAAQQPVQVPDMSILPEYLLSGCLTVEDALAAEELATPAYWVKFFFVLAGNVAGACMLISIAASSRTLSPWASNIIFLLGFAIFPGLFLFLTGFKRLRLHRMAKRKAGIFAFTQTKIVNAHLIRIAGETESVLPWSAFSHFKVNERVVLLFAKDSDEKLILAHSMLKPLTAWDSLLKMIQAKLEAP